MIDRFLGLRHDAVVGRHDQHHDVGDLRAAGAHHRERGVAGRVEEHDALAGVFAGAHQIGADVLRDAAGFALGDARLADRVEQRRLAVIDVAHDRDDRPARDQVLRIGDLVALGGDFLFEAARFDLGAEARRRATSAVSRSIAELMVIIMRRSSSALSASLTRTSRRSARSFTVMPSEKVMVRVIGGGAAGARRLLRTLQRIALLRRLQAGRAMLLLRAEARPHRRLARTLRHAAWPDAPAATAADADRRASPRCCSAADAADPNGRCPCGRARLPVAACGGRGAAAARRAAAAARPAASAAAAARSAAPCRVLRRAGECSAARSGRRLFARGFGGLGAGRGGSRRFRAVRPRPARAPRRPAHGACFDLAGASTGGARRLDRRRRPPRRASARRASPS